ncbi:hypothetical protein AVEN_185624-1 [Araneus ventricosus]|uniref:Regulatory protein zeste n=1 Tax=Araneus ventricosus TaxID=182803 RepID=A0A4Y2JXB5_ARAVE|nr:hypothetical protein AVEN_185624-1 [Araneus ventricosus]
MEVRKIFTEFEREVVLFEVDAVKHIVENKVQNYITRAKKDAAWEKIARNFNSTPGVHKRTAKQLHNLYKNMKRKAVKDRASERVEQFKTGGGPFKTPPSNPINEKLLEMGVVRQPLPNPVDDDHDYMSPFYYDSVRSHDEQTIDAEVNQNESDQLDSLVANGDEEASVSATPSRRWKLPKRRRKATPSTTIAANAMAEECRIKVEMLKIESTRKEEKHEAEMAFHDLQMKIMQQNHEMNKILMDEKIKFIKLLKECAVKGRINTTIESITG